MGDATDRNAIITPEDCLALLPALSFDLSTEEKASELGRVELRQSVLTIAELNHVSETALVRAVVKNALGRLPNLDE